MRKVLSYDDVLLVPKYSEITSRSQVDVSADLDTVITLDLPIVGAPMDTVVGPDMAAALSRMGTFGVLHRYCSIEDSCKCVVTNFTMGKFSLKNCGRYTFRFPS